MCMLPVYPDVASLEAGSGPRPGADPIPIYTLNLVRQKKKGSDDRKASTLFWSPVQHAPSIARLPVPVDHVSMHAAGCVKHKRNDARQFVLRRILPVLPGYGVVGRLFTACDVHGCSILVMLVLDIDMGTKQPSTASWR